MTTLASSRALPISVCDRHHRFLFSVFVFCLLLLVRRSSLQLNTRFAGASPQFQQFIFKLRGLHTLQRSKITAHDLDKSHAKFGTARIIFIERRSSLALSRSMTCFRSCHRQQTNNRRRMEMGAANIWFVTTGRDPVVHAEDQLTRRFRLAHYWRDDSAWRPGPSPGMTAVTSKQKSAACPKQPSCLSGKTLVVASHDHPKIERMRSLVSTTRSLQRSVSRRTCGAVTQRKVRRARQQTASGRGAAPVPAATPAAANRVQFIDREVAHWLFRHDTAPHSAPLSRPALESSIHSVGGKLKESENLNSRENDSMAALSTRWLSIDARHRADPRDE